MAEFFAGRFLIVALISIASLWGIPCYAGDMSLTLKSDSDIATAGFYRLSWIADQPVELQESVQADFSDARVVYRGADTAMFVSGKSDGSYFYRARSADSTQSWSEVVKVSVEHHSLPRAFTFLAIGIVVFLATIALIVNGSRNADG